MNVPKPPRWLEWAREIQALTQTSLHYAENHYQRERYQRLTEIAAEIITAHSGLDYSPLVDALRAQVGYATPKIDVRGAVIHEGKLLLVREIMDGRWTMPGGWGDVGDVPSQAAEREVLEESGYHVTARKLVGVYDANRNGPLEVFHAFKIVFLCDLVGGEAQTSDETSEVAFFGKEAIPKLLSPARTQPRHISDAFAAYEDPQYPAQFD